MNYLLLEVTDCTTVKVAASFTDEATAIETQVGLENLRIAKGIKVREQYFAVREENDPHSPLIALLKAEPEEVSEAPQKPRKPRTRTVEGITLVSQGNHYWKSEDGNYTIEYDDTFETECDTPHPVKISAATRRWWAGLTSHERAHVPSDLRFALEDGKKGYYCLGGRVHHYSLWVAYSEIKGDVIIRAETFGEALDALGRHIRTGETWG